MVDEYRDERDAGQRAEGQTAALYVYGVLDDLAAYGLVIPGGVQITAKGREAYRLLREGGYRPTRCQVVVALAVDAARGGAEVDWDGLEALARMVCLRVDGEV